MGTVDYISPEQVRGATLDGRSDLYSLGVVLYEMLVGHTPFAGRDPYDVLQAHVLEAPPLLPAGLPRAVREVTERALQKGPDPRYESASTMVEALTMAQRSIADQRTTPNETVGARVCR